MTKTTVNQDSCTIKEDNTIHDTKRKPSLRLTMRSQSQSKQQTQCQTIVHGTSDTVSMYVQQHDPSYVDDNDECESTSTMHTTNSHRPNNTTTETVTSTTSNENDNNWNEGIATTLYTRMSSECQKQDYLQDQEGGRTFVAVDTSSTAATAVATARRNKSDEHTTSTTNASQSNDSMDSSPHGDLQSTSTSSPSSSSSSSSSHRHHRSSNNRHSYRHRQASQEPLFRSLKRQTTKIGHSKPSIHLKTNTNKKNAQVPILPSLLSSLSSSSSQSKSQSQKQHHHHHWSTSYHANNPCEDKYASLTNVILHPITTTTTTTTLTKSNAGVQYKVNRFPHNDDYEYDLQNEDKDDGVEDCQSTYSSSSASTSSSSSSVATSSSSLRYFTPNASPSPLVSEMNDFIPDSSSSIPTTVAPISISKHTMTHTTRKNNHTTQDTDDDRDHDHDSDIESTTSSSSSSSSTEYDSPMTVEQDITDVKDGGGFKVFVQKEQHGNDDDDDDANKNTIHTKNRNQNSCTSPSFFLRMSLFTVLDGHGGSTVSNLASQKLLPLLSRNISSALKCQVIQKGELSINGQDQQQEVVRSQSFKSNRKKKKNIVRRTTSKKIWEFREKNDNLDDYDDDDDSIQDDNHDDIHCIDTTNYWYRAPEHTMFQNSHFEQDKNENDDDDDNEDDEETDFQASCATRFHRNTVPTNSTSSFSNSDLDDLSHTPTIEVETTVCENNNDFPSPLLSKCYTTTPSPPYYSDLGKHSPQEVTTITKTIQKSFLQFDEYFMNSADTNRSTQTCCTSDGRWNVGSCCIVAVVLQRVDVVMSPTSSIKCDDDENDDYDEEDEDENIVYDESTGQYYKSGKTMLYTAHVGDCRGILLEESPREQEVTSSDQESSDAYESSSSDSYTSDDYDSDDYEEKKSNSSSKNVFRSLARFMNHSTKTVRRVCGSKVRNSSQSLSSTVVTNGTPQLLPNLFSHTLTKDHTPYNATEALLVEERSNNAPRAISKGVNGGIKRVAGSLAVTRALGDAYLKSPQLSFHPYKKHAPYITALPDVNATLLEKDSRFLVLASDGLWENVSGSIVSKWITRFYNSFPVSSEEKYCHDSFQGMNDEEDTTGIIVKRSKRKHDNEEEDLCMKRTKRRRMFLDPRQEAKHYTPGHVRKDYPPETNMPLSSLSMNKVSDVIVMKILDKVRIRHNMSVRTLISLPKGHARRVKHDDITVSVIDLVSLLNNF